MRDTVHENLENKFIISNKLKVRRVINRMSFLLTIIYVPKLAYRVPCGVNLTQLFTNKAKVFLSIVSGDMPEDLIPGPVKAHLLCAQ